jgi:hypothetical protein
LQAQNTLDEVWIENRLTDALVRTLKNRKAEVKLDVCFSSRIKEGLAYDLVVKGLLDIRLYKVSNVLHSVVERERDITEHSLAVLLLFLLFYLLSLLRSI